MTRKEAIKIIQAKYNIILANMCEIYKYLVSIMC